MSFNDLGLSNELLQAISDRGFETPSEIQEKAIPLLLENDVDFVGQAQTGTGKTAAFALPLLDKIDPKSKKVQAIVLAPTRELANQIEEEIRKFCKYKNIKSLSVYGGMPIDRQIRGLKKFSPQIVIGTPGRFLDLLNRGSLDIENAKYAVLDEADEMLDMGFLDDVKEILSLLSDQRNIWMFSATMPKAILQLIQSYLSSPEKISIKKKTLSNENIEQKYFVVRERDYTDALVRILYSLEDYYSIVFCKTKLETKKLTDDLNAQGLLADSLHGDLDQKHRDSTMRRFKNKEVKLLVCTDVAARGIDVNDLTHVFNYGTPQDNESYIHRIGRTGRAGQKGQAILIVAPQDLYRIKHIENLTKAKINKSKLPEVNVLKSAIVKNQTERILSSLNSASNLKDSGPLETFMNLFAEAPKEEITKAFYLHLFGESFKQLDRKGEIDISDRNAGKAARGERSSARNGRVRVFVNFGRNEGVPFKSFLAELSDKLKIQERRINNVDMKDAFSFFEIPQEYEGKVINNRDVMIGDKKLNFEISSAPSYSGRSSRGRKFSGRKNSSSSPYGERRGGDRRSNSGRRSNNSGDNRSRGSRFPKDRNGDVNGNVAGASFSL